MQSKHKVRANNSLCQACRDKKRRFGKDSQNNSIEVLLEISRKSVAQQQESYAEPGSASFT
jgi:hypothetical protein